MPDYLLKDIPEKLYTKIKELAEKERRSIKNQIIIMLQAQADTMSTQDGSKKQ